ncbi:MAG: FtsQ-type POTRA domain-containing protein [Candidatus Zophobacter franzmannii]|nr:FtsQ-type POTRA domain-containing protein [Candidatus Zophobacter franzmannii]
MKKKVHGNSRYLAYAVTILLTLVIIFTGILMFLQQWDKCNITEIIIKNNKIITTVQLEKLLDQYLSRNLYKVNKQKIEDELLEIYRIESVRISRAPLNKLKVKIYERPGFINIITKTGSIYTLDSEGVVLNRFNYNKEDDFAIIRTKINPNKLSPGSVVESDMVQKIIAYHKKLLEVKPEIEIYISEYFMDGKDICFYEMESGKKIIIDLRYLEDNISMFFTLLENIRIEKYKSYTFKYKDKVIKE